jgi:hypothetical protein
MLSRKAADICREELNTATEVASNAVRYNDSWLRKDLEGSGAGALPQFASTARVVS